MDLGPRGIRLIKASEEYRSRAYRPTTDDVWTIGWGHTRGVVEGRTCTPAEAEEWLRQDTAGAAAAVNALGLALSQSMFDAVVSLVFNAGFAPIKAGSTIGDALRAGDHFAAWRGLSLWTKQAGHDLRGLARRRAAEMALFFEDPLP
jgi:lysozyme